MSSVLQPCTSTFYPDFIFPLITVGLGNLLDLWRKTWSWKCCLNLQNFFYYSVATSCTFRNWAQRLAYHNSVLSMRRAIIYKLRVLDVLFGETFTFESICFLLFTGKAEIDVTIANVLSVCWMWNWFFDRHGLFCEFFFEFQNVHRNTKH